MSPINRVAACLSLGVQSNQTPIFPPVPFPSRIRSEHRVMGLRFDDDGLSARNHNNEARTIPNSQCRWANCHPCLTSIQSEFPHVVSPALKRTGRVETVSRSAKALLPPHKCGGCHHPSLGLAVLTQTLKPGCFIKFDKIRLFMGFSGGAQKGLF